MSRATPRAPAHRSTKIEATPDERFAATMKMVDEIFARKSPLRRLGAGPYLERVYVTGPHDHAKDLLRAIHRLRTAERDLTWLSLRFSMVEERGEGTPDTRAAREHANALIWRDYHARLRALEGLTVAARNIRDAHEPRADVIDLAAFKAKRAKAV